MTSLEVHLGGYSLELGDERNCFNKSLAMPVSGEKSPKGLTVESRCGAVAVGLVCLLPPLSSGGALVASP
jgi:hypothetical protein